MNSLKMQFVLIALTCIVLSVLVIPLTSRFSSTDPFVAIEYVIPEQQKSVNFARVETGFIVTDVLDFDTRENEFKVDAVIWFSFDPSKISLETIDKFTFLNGSIESKSAPSTELLHNRILAKYSIRVSFSTVLDYKLFPVDDHRIVLTLVNKQVSPDEMIYEVKGADFIVSSQIRVHGWEFCDKYVEYGYIEIKIQKGKVIQYPVVVFELDFKKIGFGGVMPVFVPLMIMFFMAMICFSLIAIGRSDAALSISLANESVMIGYLFVLQNLVPRVGYFTFANYIFVFVFMVSFLALTISIFVYKTKKVPRWLYWFNNIVVPLLYLLLFVIVYIFLYVFPEGI